MLGLCSKRLFEAEVCDFAMGILCPLMAEFFEAATVLFPEVVPRSFLSVEPTGTLFSTEPTEHLLSLEGNGLFGGRTFGAAGLMGPVGLEGPLPLLVPRGLLGWGCFLKSTCFLESEERLPLLLLKFNF
uniref:Uncharacterized protein n=1 Tax=Opuntia streptacantha TaxID=393608 RepID=A0A7C9AXW8_OPUST